MPHMLRHFFINHWNVILLWAQCGVIGRFTGSIQHTTFLEWNFTVVIALLDVEIITCLRGSLLAAHWELTSNKNIYVYLVYNESLKLHWYSDFYELKFFQFRGSVHHNDNWKTPAWCSKISIYFTYMCSLHVSGKISPIIRSYRTVQIQIW